MKTLICSGFLLLLVSCYAVSDINRVVSPTATLIDPHHHSANANNNSLGPQNIPYFSVTIEPMDAATPREGNVMNESKALHAFTTCNEVCRIFVQDLVKGEVYELHAPSFILGRPFSDLVWIDDRILIFDQWTQPYYGMHYAVNVPERKMLLASPVSR